MLRRPGYWHLRIAKCARIPPFSLPPRGGGPGPGGEGLSTHHPHSCLPPSRGKEFGFSPGLSHSAACVDTNGDLSMPPHPGLAVLGIRTSGLRHWLNYIAPSGAGRIRIVCQATQMPSNFGDVTKLGLKDLELFISPAGGLPGFDGMVVWSPVKSLWLTMQALVALVGGYFTFRLSRYRFKRNTVPPIIVSDTILSMDGTSDRDRRRSTQDA